MKNSQKGSIMLVLSIIIVVLVIVFGIYIYFQNSQTPQQVSNSQTTTQNTQPVAPETNSVTQSKTQDVTAGWKTYTDVNQGFSFKYPSSWTYQKFSCNLDGVAFYPTGSSAVTCSMDSPVAPIYLYPKSGGQQTTSASLVLSTQFSGNSSYKGIFDQMVKTFTSSGNSTTKTTQAVKLTVWPDVNSFNLTNKTFQAKGVGADIKIGTKIIKTDSSTKYYTMADSKILGYKDFQWLYSTLKNWVGPEWMFNINGKTQSDGSILASEIYMVAQ